MRGRLAAAAPLAASLLAHGALLAAAAGAGFLAPAPAPRAAPPPASRRVTAVPLLLLPGPGEPDGAGGAASVVSLDDPDPAHRPYLQAVKERIWRRWEAPRLAPGQEARGSLALEFTLTEGGALAAARVTDGSGSPALDRAALEAVRGAAPFPPVPRQIAAGPLRVRARFLYE